MKMNIVKKNYLFIFFLVFLISFIIYIILIKKIDNKERDISNKSEINIEILKEPVSLFIKELIKGSDFNKDKLDIAGDWKINISLFLNNKKLIEVDYEGEKLSDTIIGAVDKIKKEEIDIKKLEDIFFLIKINSSSNNSIFAFNNEKLIDLEDENGLISLVYDLDKKTLEEKIEENKKFLFKMGHPEENGFFKYYLPFEENNFEERLHTTYSASIIYSFLFLNEFKEDKEILDNLNKWGDFLLKMQNREEGDNRYGAFVYSYFFNNKNYKWGDKIEKTTIGTRGERIKDSFYVDEGGRELNYVIGTNSKTIFTLIRLYEYTGDNKYLESAKIAGDWLLTMQREDGAVKPYVTYRDGKWFFGGKESLLYQGQVLLAFSRLYKETKDEKYYIGAKKIAERFSDMIEEAKGGFIVDEYRNINAISNSWVVMSLIDFYKIDKNNYYRDLIFQHSKEIIKDQIIDEKNILDFGRYKTAYSTSGSGWIAEVLTEVYRFCIEEKRDDCNLYKESVLRAIRWIIQHTYSEENTFYIENGKDIIGGAFWNREYRHIRSDSIAHSLNAYTRIINYLEEEDKILLPKK